jgi:general stress protein CsbA
MKELLQIKKIIALVLTLVFAILSIKGTISAEQFITVFSMIIGFYFSQSAVRQTMKENK